MNLFLTEDGVLKLGTYGLTTQLECYSIKETDCEGLRSFASEVFEGEYEMKSDVWSLGITMFIMMGITVRVRFDYNYCSRRREFDRLDYDSYAFALSEEFADFIQKCSKRKNDRWSVKELMNVSEME